MSAFVPSKVQGAATLADRSGSRPAARRSQSHGLVALWPFNHHAHGKAEATAVAFKSPPLAAGAEDR